MTGYKYPRIEREHIPQTVQELEILNKLLTLIVLRKISQNGEYYYLAIWLFLYLFIPTK